MDRQQLYRDALRRAGLRMTRPREVICAYLAATDAHPTPYKVYDDLSRTHPEISRATVYNTLNTLQQLGAIVELSFGADHTHYDTNPQPHVNLICLRCHRIVDLDLSGPFAGIRELLGDETGFQALVARAEVLGICAGCHVAAERGAAQDGAASPITDKDSDVPAETPATVDPQHPRKAVAS